ncbi:glycosyltransferase [Synechococcus sp. MIT S9503]|uniref:glycosyltransferase n=1 Tax=Synechococcus sp. MIT S9503 TaxID=3082547 RepID=UPI0039A55B03
MSSKIIQLVRHPLRNKGGIEIVAREIHLQIVSPCKGTTYSLCSIDQSSIIKDLNECSLLSFDLFKLKLPFPSFKLFDFIKQLRHSSHVIVHFPDPYFALVSFLFATTNNTKLIVFWHADHGRSGIFSFLLSHLEKLCLSKSYRIICTSPKLAKESSSIGKYCRKIATVPLFCDPPWQPEIRSYEQRKYDCIYVGRVESYKNIKLLIDDFILSNARTLAIAGSGRDLTYFREYARKLCGPDKVITFYGLVSDSIKYHLLCNSRIFILSSTRKAEAFGIVQCEAFSCGTPVLSYNIEGSGVSWVNINGVTGFTPQIKFESHFNYINKLLDPQLWHKFSRNCLNRSRVFTKKNFDSNISNIFNT